MQAEIDSAIRSVLEKFHRVVPEKPIAFFPAFDIVESEDECRLYLSLPGMEEEDIDIAVEGTQLIVRGEREAPFDRSGVTVRLGEWRYGFFERRVELPEKFTTESLQATYYAGVLTIRLSRKDGKIAKEDAGTGGEDEVS